MKERTQKGHEAFQLSGSIKSWRKYVNTLPHILAFPMLNLQSLWQPSSKSSQTPSRENQRRSLSNNPPKADITILKSTHKGRSFTGPKATTKRSSLLPEK